MSYLSGVNINGVWGYKDFTIPLDKSISFLIGGNGSGKTTAINIISKSISVDVSSLIKLTFERIVLSFSGGQVITVEKDKKHRIKYDVTSGETRMFSLFEHDEPSAFSDIREDELRELIKTFFRMSYLPLSRGLLSPSDDYFFDKINDPIDEKLKYIKDELITRFSRTSKTYNKIASSFQRGIFSKLLEIPNERDIFPLSKNLDSDEMALREISGFISNGENSRYEKKLNSYLQELKSVVNKRESTGNNRTLSISELGVVFNAWRTRSLIEEYNNLKKKKNEIFKSQNDFFDVFKKFFSDGKELILSNQNDLVMKTKKGHVSVFELSSGEKQLIILLGQIYLSDRREVMYIADEPEVSLHVKWQDKIVDALLSINPDAQILLATHSPDIVGRRRDNAVRV